MVSKLDNITPLSSMNQPSSSSINDIPAKNFPLETEKNIEKIVEEIKREPLDKTLRRLIRRISSIIEEHIFEKRNSQFHNREETKEIVQDQKNIRYKQGGTYGFEAAFSVIIPIISTLVPAPWSDLFRGLGQLSHPAMQAIISTYDAKLSPLSHQQTLNQHDLQVVKDLLELLKQFPEKLQNLIIEMMRMDLQAYREIAGQG